MNSEEFREYCLAKSGVSEGFPFGENVLVFKVMDKMFATAALDENPLRVNLKCDPEKAVKLREKFPNVLPGYHMNKKHWNTVIMDGSASRKDVQEWINHSYDLVAKKLSKKKQEKLKFYEE